MESKISHSTFSISKTLNTLPTKVIRSEHDWMPFGQRANYYYYYYNLTPRGPDAYIVRFHN